MRRLVVAFLALGFILPLILLAAQFLLLAVSPESVSYFRGAWIYVWPSVVFLMAFAGAPAAFQLLGVAISVAVNIALYALVGLIVGALWRWLRPN